MLQSMGRSGAKRLRYGSPKACDRDVACFECTTATGNNFSASEWLQSHGDDSGDETGHDAGTNSGKGAEQDG